jgi:hypothetical protein
MLITEPKIQTKLNHLFNLALNIKTIGHDLFFDWSPHVFAIEIRLFLDGWQPGKDPEFIKVIYFWADSDENLAEVVKNKIDIINKVITDIIALLPQEGFDNE